MEKNEIINLIKKLSKGKNIETQQKDIEATQPINPEIDKDQLVFDLDIKEAIKGLKGFKRIQKDWKDLKRIEKDGKGLKRIEKDWQGLKEIEKDWKGLKRNEKDWKG